MDLAPAVLARLPLAEAVLTAWQWMAGDAFLGDLFDRHRGRCYTRAVRFPTLARLIHDALTGAADSAHQRFARAAAGGELPAHPQAAYDKLGRLPVAVSTAFLAGCTARLREVLPDPRLDPLPAAVDGWQVVAIDGKAVEHVAKRLGPARGVRGGVLGGRALVALAVDSGLVLGMHADPDGEANDVRFVPALVPAVRARVGGPILWVGDRQFGFPEVLARLSSPDDRFVARYHGNVAFAPDPGRPARSGVDPEGRAYREDWGWLGGRQNRHRREVRRVTPDLGAGTRVVVTDVLDADAVPAADVPAVYRRRWGIENVFQQVTEVFGLARLIGGTPEATVFQRAFCLVLYNLIQAVRGVVAGAGGRAAAEVSGEKVFRDVRKELISWRTVLTADETVAAVAAVLTAAGVRERLAAVLGGVWRAEWVKAKRKRKAVPHPARPWQSGDHQSVHRLLRGAREVRGR